MSDRNKVHNISAMGIQTQDRWIVLVLIYESGIQVLDQNKTKAVEFPLRDALIVHTDQKLIDINSIYQFLHCQEISVLSKFKFTFLLFPKKWTRRYTTGLTKAVAYDERPKMKWNARQKSSPLPRK